MKKYLLIAEDDKFYGTIYLNKFTREGYDVKVVTDGGAFIDQIEIRMPDLALLDLVMPGKDGFWVLSELKKRKLLPKLKVLTISNLGQEEEIRKVKEYNVCEYMVKANMSLEEIINKVRSYI